MGYADRFGRGYLTGFNTIETTGNVTIATGSKLVTDRIDVDDLYERTASNGIDVNSALDILDDVTNLSGDLLAMRGLPTDSTTATPADGTTYCLYLGRAPRKITSARLSVVVGGTAAATVSWAELALATGTYEAPDGTTNGSPDLTLVAGSVVDIATPIAAGTNREAGGTSTPTTPIAAGTDLWLLFGISATTLPVMRATPRSLVSGSGSVAATRPSTMAAATAFSGDGIVGGSTHVWHGVRIVS